ncbi:hypothetical protein D9M72_590500 [compost metagenome]
MRAGMMSPPFGSLALLARLHSTVATPRASTVTLETRMDSGVEEKGRMIMSPIMKVLSRSRILVPPDWATRSATMEAAWLARRSAI